MPVLPDELFTLVEKRVLEARSVAEEAAEAAINTLAVNRASPFSTLSPEERRLRNALRARARQLGDGSQHRGLPLLVEEIAYQQWHRMLFARFLAENGLLMHPSGIPVTLQDCAELAPEEREPDAWSLAARYASGMLPGIFRQDDPVVQVRFAPEGRLTLEAILNDLPSLVFTADDSLGWMYQFWQTQKKKEVNASERKIGGSDIAPVTQLFTEEYMVRFLLENSLGAWWVARHPDSPLVKDYKYLRFREDGTPAAGTFPGWPDRAAEVTVMDPCCGSGHFLVVAFEMLWRMRMEEEGLGEAEAADAVLRDNLFGLEIDPRCTQIAAFGLALVAWKAGGYRDLPVPNVACSGIPVQGQLQTWTKLAVEDANLAMILERLYRLFQNAASLGSLINPAKAGLRSQMFYADCDEAEPLLRKALDRERRVDDPAGDVFGAAVRSVTRAARLLSVRYTLVVTNVPFLSRGNQDEVLKDFCGDHYPHARADLATVFLERSLDFCSSGGTVALVTPQNWLFLGAYEELRRSLLKRRGWNSVAKLGENGFRSTQAAGAFTALIVLTNALVDADNTFAGLDASKALIAAEKATILRRSPIQFIAQRRQLENPDARVILGESQEGELLQKYAASFQGIKTGDDPRYKRCFWEVAELGTRWRLCQSTVKESKPYGGMEYILDWRRNGRDMARLQGLAAWGRPGVAISQMRGLPAALYSGGVFDSNVSPIIPNRVDHLPALWSFCLSSRFAESVRQIDQSLKVTNSSLVKIPIDLAYWKHVAESAGPLPEVHTDDPTQWVFAGHPVDSAEPLQVSVARLLGYQWPDQKPDSLDHCANDEGIVCLPPVAGIQSAAERLHTFLKIPYGDAWFPAVQEGLLAAVGFSGKDLHEWLQDGFFAQHCKLFGNRPFIWHIWDGRKDGFSALANYHKLDVANLDKLIYTYLGGWIRVQRSRRDAGESGADARLVAALELQKKLEAIRDGEPPYDIYVRWKPLHEQPIGWTPDLNDGVRLNIRPFVTARVLRRKFTIHWKKDRGKNPDGSERINDHHFSVAQKLEARRQWEAGKEAQPTNEGKGQH